MGRDSDDNWDDSSFGDDFSGNWDEEEDDLFSDDKPTGSWDNGSSLGGSSNFNESNNFDISSGGKMQSSDNNWGEDDGWANDDDGWGDAPNENLMASEEIGGTGDIEEQAIEEKNNQIKQVATYGIIAGIIVIILVCLVARLRNKATETALNNKVEASQSVKPQSNTNNNKQQVVNQPVASVQNSNSGWSKIAYDTSWKFSEPIDGTFTVTAVDTYAKILNNGEVQIRTEVTGSIAGLLGTYSIEIPSEVTSVVSVASMLNVTYQIAESGNNRIVTNIEIK